MAIRCAAVWQGLPNPGFLAQLQRPWPADGGTRYPAWQWQCTACPLPSQPPARASGGNEDKGLKTRGPF